MTCVCDSFRCSCMFVCVWPIIIQLPVNFSAGINNNIIVCNCTVLKENSHYVLPEKIFIIKGASEMIPTLRSITVTVLLNGRGVAVVGRAAVGGGALVFGDKVPEGCSRHALLEEETLRH